MKLDPLCLAKAGVILAFMTLGAAAFAFGSANRPGSQGTAADTPLLQASIFMANCARCHGADGRANTDRGRQLDATDFTSDWNRDEARAIRIVTNGKGDMPSFKKKLSSKQIRSVVGYVRRIKG